MDDRARLWEEATVPKFEQRHPPVRIHREKCRRARRAVLHAVFAELDRNPYLARGQAHLVAIARLLHLVQHIHDRLRRFLRGDVAQKRTRYLCALRLPPLRDAGPTVRMITPQAMRSPELPAGWLI